MDLPGSPSKIAIFKSSGKRRLRNFFIQGILIGLLFAFTITSLSLILKTRPVENKIKPTVEVQEKTKPLKKPLLAFVGVQVKD